MEKTDKLTRKQETFCQEYIVDYNATQAAVRAGYSEDSARQIASRLLSKDNIRSRVRALQQDQTERLAVTQDYVVQQLIETYQKCCAVKPVMEWDPNEREYVEKGTFEFDSKGATKALELLGKHLGMYSDKVMLGEIKTPKFEGEQQLEE